jgi:hypothetical protein
VEGIGLTYELLSGEEGVLNELAAVEDELMVTHFYQDSSLLIKQ